MNSDSRQENEYRFLFKRAILAAVFSLPTVFYWLIKNNPAACTYFTDNISGPVKRFSASVFSVLPLSVAEFLIILAAAVTTGISIFSIIVLVRHKHGWISRFLKAFTLLLLVTLLSWSMMNIMWGVNYYSRSFSERSGIMSRGCSVDELAVVTIYFSQKLNEFSDEVSRDDEDICKVDIKSVMERAPELIDGICDDYPFLSGKDIKPRAALLSYIMSCLGTSGYTFPYTGECIINCHQPDAYIPFSAVHELSHQRNVASEDEANFTATLACMNSSYSDFRYSGALHAFISLSNSLYTVAPDFTLDIYGTLEDRVLADIHCNSRYWDRFETEVSEKSDKLYDGFLKRHDQELGIKSYGAVTDMLVAYYLKDAEAY